MTKPTESDVPSLVAWFAGRLPDGWFAGPPEVHADREEILVVGRSPSPTPRVSTTVPGPPLTRPGSRASGRTPGPTGCGSPTSRAQVRPQGRLGCGVRDARAVFTSLGVPVMTRLRMPERRVLDTLVDAGVARSRSEALAWCVRLVRSHEGRLDRAAARCAGPCRRGACPGARLGRVTAVTVP